VKAIKDLGGDEGLNPGTCAKTFLGILTPFRVRLSVARRNQGNLPLSSAKVFQAFPSPVSETVGKTTSTALIALQRALTREPKQIGVKGASIWGRMKFQTDLIGCDKCAGTVENL
jgi:hypothetical protein